MNIGINIDAYPCSVSEQVAYMKKYGFTSTFAMALSENMDEIVLACREAGIVLENLHAPFSHINDIWCDTPEGERMARELLASVDECARYGIGVLVVHLSSKEHPPRINPLGIERFERLMAYAKERGVLIAYENQRKLANLALAFEEFPDAKFCFDTGHEACFTPGRQYMPLFGDKTVAIHVHDNHAVYDGDEHLIPFDGCIDFTRVARQIAQSPYDGPLMLELAARHSAMYEKTSADDYYAHARMGAERLRDMIVRVRSGR